MRRTRSGDDRLRPVLFLRSHAPSALPPMSSPASILLVEDEFAVALELKTRLTRLGYDVAGHVMDGPSAVDRAVADAPDLVLMDIHLDGAMDGIEAARRIHAGPASPPVVFLTAYSDDETVARAAATTPFGYVVKPIEERDLYAAVEVALQTHALHERLQQANRHLETILDGLQEGALLLREDGTVSFVSRPAARLLDVDPDAAAGAPWPDVLPLDAEATSRLHRALSQKDPAEGPDGQPPGSVASLSVRYETGDGRRVHLDVEVRPDPRSAAGRILVLHDRTREAHLRRLLDDHDRFHDLVGQSPAMKNVYTHIRSLGPVDVPVQIRGETGTGKELVARALHAESTRADGPFVAVNCAALQAPLAGSLLFGHRRGAFTGAVDDRPGYFEAADGGTLFLDEIGDLPLEVQQQFLRVLEERRVSRLGETREREVDVRLLSATHQPLEAAVDDGTFREDLLYRLRVARLDLPPLRDRLSDLPLLVRVLQQDAEARMDLPPRTFGENALRALLNYDWPGNVRELRNVVTAALIRASETTVRCADLPPEVRSPGRTASHRAGTSSPQRPEHRAERERIRAALKETEGNRSAAADLLGISRSTLYRRLRSLDLED